MEITNVNQQTVNANGNVLFTNTPIKGNCSIIHRDGSGQVKLRGLTRTQSRARFRVFFGGNVAIPDGGTINPITVALTIDGEPLLTTEMIVTPSAVGEFFNIAGSMFVDVPACCCSVIGVTNIGTTPILVQNANLIVEREA